MTGTEKRPSTIHTCDCTACGGFTFTAPEGKITGTPRQVRDMVHNYAQMVRNPAMAGVMAARGLKAA